MNKNKYLTLIIITLLLFGNFLISGSAHELTIDRNEDNKKKLCENPIQKLSFSNGLKDGLSLGISGISNNVIIPQNNEIKTKTKIFNFNPLDCNLNYWEKNFAYLNLKNTIPSGYPGTPMIPMKTVTFELPKNSGVVDITINDAYYLEIENKLNFPPNPKPIIWSSEKINLKDLSNVTGINQEIYSLNEYYPGTAFDYYEGCTNENKMVFIHLYPVQYIPRIGRTILLTEGKVNLAYKEKINNFLTSDTNIDAENIIITTQELFSEAKDLEKFHDSNGTSTDIINVSWIYNNFKQSDDPPVGGYKDKHRIGRRFLSNYNYTLAKKIISFLNDTSAHPNLKYVTILGNAVMVPPSYYFSRSLPIVLSVDNWDPTDFYYSSPDLDFIPNYDIGRIPVDNKVQAKKVINKIINWSESSNTVKNVTISGGKPFNTDSFIGELITINAVNQGIFDGTEIEKLFYSKNTYTKNDFLRSLTYHHPGIIFNIGHGFCNQTYFEGNYTKDNVLTSQEILELPDNNNLPVIFSIACLNGAYDGDLVKADYNNSIGESFLLSEGGGIAYIGGSRGNAGSPLFNLNQGYVDIYKLTYMAGLLTYALQESKNESKTLGEITSKARIKYVQNNNMTDYLTLHNYFSFILLGDPVLKVPPRSSGESYQISETFPENPVDYVKYRVNGTIPISILNESLIIRSTTDSPSVLVREIDAVNISLHNKEVQLFVNNEVTYDFTANKSSLYNIRIVTEDGKESWFYTDSYVLVDDDFNESTPGFRNTRWSKIQDAVDNSDDSTSIYVMNGTYHENIVLNKNIFLRGSNKYETIIDGGEKGSVVTISSPFYECGIHGFTIQNSGGNKNNLAGIKIEVKKEGQYGIYSNIIKNNDIGLYITSSLMDRVNLIVDNNNITDNNYGFYSNSKNLELFSLSTLTKNQIKNNEYGIYLLGSRFNIISSNNITNNQIGIYIKNSKRNYVLLNNFIDNSIQATYVKSSKNLWLMNYWDNWIGLRFKFLRFMPKYIVGRNGLILGIIPTKDRDIFPLREPISFEQ